MIDKMIVDADLCIKLGGSSKYRYLYDILPLISKKIYMHTHAYGEVMMPSSAVSQLKDLISEGKVELVNESELEAKDRIVYDIAYRNLERGMVVPKGQYHLVVSIWIMNSKGEYLLSQRHPDKSYPLSWECTGGHITVGEDSLSGAIREVGEELGIKLDADEGKIIYQVRREETQDFYDVWLFHKDVDISAIKIQEIEVFDVKWVTKDELMDMYKAGKLHPLINYLDNVF